jgi:hypothetical protein
VVSGGNRLGGGGDGGRLRAQAAEAMAVCGCFEMRQRREEKRSAGGFEAQTYSSVNR